MGLAITQTMALSGMVQWGMRQSAEVSNQLTAVERIVEYTELESEPNLETGLLDKDKGGFSRTFFERYNFLQISRK